MVRLREVKIRIKKRKGKEFIVDADSEQARNYRSVFSVLLQLTA